MFWSGVNYAACPQTGEGIDPKQAPLLKKIRKRLAMQDKTDTIAANVSQE